MYLWLYDSKALNFLQKRGGDNLVKYKIREETCVQNKYISKNAMYHGFEIYLVCKQA